MHTAQSQASVSAPLQAAVQWTEMALPISVGSAHLALRQCQPRAAAPLAQVVVAGAMVQAVRAGARGYLLKDEPAHEIVTAIDAVMAGRSYFSAAVAVRLSQASAPATLLTQRERDVLRHIASGHANKQIAQALGLSVRTVETHRLNIKRKLGIDGQAELIKYAVENRGV